MTAATLPSMLDPPFLAPLECVVDLPFPVSANRLWTARGGGHGQLRMSARYMAWKDRADLEVIANGSWRHRVRIPAQFTALLLLDRARRQQTQDIDNLIKGCLDWAQRVEIVTNDRLCEEVTARWVPTTEAPKGARLILRSAA